MLRACLCCHSKVHVSSQLLPLEVTGAGIVDLCWLTFHRKGIAIKAKITALIPWGLMEAFKEEL